MSKKQYHSSDFQSSAEFNSTKGWDWASPLKYNTNWSKYPVPKNPTNNCIFCHEFHWSHLCLEVSSLETRMEIFQNFGLCAVCGKRQHSCSCSSADIWCKWPQCAAKNDHNTTICPNVKYPITEDIVEAYKTHINYVWELHQTQSPSSFNDMSQFYQKKDWKCNRKLSSNAKTLTHKYHTNMFI